METLGGGWTQFAFHRDGKGKRPVLSRMDGKSFGVLSDAHWRYLIENMHGGMMFKDEYQRLSYVSAQRLNGANCVRPSSIASLHKTTHLKLWHHENLKCNASGRDYSLIELSSKGYSGASVYQESRVKFNIWGYPSSISYPYQKQLHYFIR